MSDFKRVHLGLRIMSTELKFNPDISVVMSVYNETEYLQESIDSILCQTYQNFEFIIVADGSNDKTRELVEQCSRHDKRIIVLKNKTNIGLTRSLNKAISLARGTFIARQDADDVSLPTRLEKQIKFLEEHPNYVLVSCNLERIDSKGHRLTTIKILDAQYLLEWNLLFFNYISGHSQVMFRKKEFKKSGGYCEAFTYAQDYDLWTRLLKIGKFKILNEILVKNREHRNQLSNKVFLKQLEFVFKVSQNQIQSLINIEMTTSEIADLWSFWTFSKLPKNLRKIDTMFTFDNRRLKLIYDKFIFQKNLRGKPQSDAISKLIGERYIKWFFYELFIGRGPKLAYQYLGFSIEWLGFKTPFFVAKVLSDTVSKYYRSINHLYSTLCYRVKKSQFL